MDKFIRNGSVPTARAESAESVQATRSLPSLSRVSRAREKRPENEITFQHLTMSSDERPDGSEAQAQLDSQGLSPAVVDMFNE